MSDFANPEDLLNHTQVRYDEVDTDAGKFLIRSLSELERSEFEAWVAKGKGSARLVRMKRSRCKLITCCVVDPKTKQPVWSELHIPKLLQVDGRVTGRLFDAICDHVGFTEGDLEELVKNSEKTQDDDSN